MLQEGVTGNTFLLTASTGFSDLDGLSLDDAFHVVIAGIRICSEILKLGLERPQFLK